MEHYVKLKSKKEVFVLRKHPWVFSGAIGEYPEGLEEGMMVAVLDNKGAQLATGHYQEGSIRVRILYHGQDDRPTDFWSTAIQRAYDTRQIILKSLTAATNTYRLVHGAGDLLPGLVIDIYNQLAVVQCHSMGMYHERQAIAEALQAVYGEQLQHIYLRARKTLPQRFSEEVFDGFLHGNTAEVEVAENGHRFNINAATGQKTGFFLDQRDNRSLLAQYAPGKTVLNTFCYTGGFSIYALQAGAAQVTSVDISGKAMELTSNNVELNGFAAEQHRGVTGDVLQFLRKEEESFDIVVVDPPAYAKSYNKRHRAVQGYKRLNAGAIKRVKPGGLLFTFSCSQVVDRKLFQDTIVAAGLEAGRSARVLHQLTQSPDHPVNLFHPEGAYLKGLVLQFD
ncbi:MAG: class I SAM-dependent rRNA methyltransferase [Bacteroidota bacterium]